MRPWENTPEFAYTTALNDLLSHRDYTFPAGDSMIVFWAKSSRRSISGSVYLVSGAKTR